MPKEDSEPLVQAPSIEDLQPGTTPKYRFDFSEQGPYGAAARLLSAHAPQGVVLDIGCGYGAIGEHLAQQGREYVGLDQDANTIEDLRARSLEAQCLDLSSNSDPGRLADQIMVMLGRRPLGAILLLDVLEHLPRPELALELVSVLAAKNKESFPEWPALVLVTSIPNVAHVDLGAKLLAGRWDVTPSGLLDATHVQFFTKARILSLLGTLGYELLAEEDIILPHSDQHFPEDHPFIGPTVLRSHLEHLRALADDNGAVNQFVQAWRIPTGAKKAMTWRSGATAEERRRTSVEPIGGASTEGLAPGTRSIDAPFLSVLVRTTGNRNSMLAEALTCLAAQTMDSLEVILLIHLDPHPAEETHDSQDSYRSSDPRSLEGDPEPNSNLGDHHDPVNVIERISELVAGFPEDFRSRVRLKTVTRSGRSAPLNDGVAVSKGNYVAFLDDDDLVTADWAASFLEGAKTAPGNIIRTQTRARSIEPTHVSNQDGPIPRTLSQLRVDFADRFDFLDHLATNHTPINSMAIPATVLRDLHLDFDETMELCEDWDLLLRASELTGVTETGKPTAIYQRWISPAETDGQLDPAWASAHKRILHKLSERPLLLPAGTAKRLGVVMADPRQLELKELEREALQDALSQAELQIQRLTKDLELAATTNRQLTDSLHATQSAIAELKASTSWRATAPLRSIHALLRYLKKTFLP